MIDVVEIERDATAAAEACDVYARALLPDEAADAAIARPGGLAETHGHASL